MNLHDHCLQLREPSLRAHEAAMVKGSKVLIAALWKQHPRIIARLTGKGFSI